jgi:predicted transcriptional regulator
MSPTRVEAADDVIYQALQDEIVLLNMNDQKYFGLDDVGSEMWKLLVEHGNVETVTDRLCSEYDVDRATVQADLDILIRNLLNAGLLKASEKVSPDGQ